MRKKSAASSQESEAGQSLLAVFAHPDDESLACGGLLAWCTARGARVALLCLTHGEHGETDEASLPPGTPSLRDIRAAELADAAGVLGIEDVTLLDYEDGMLPWAKTEQLDKDIGAVMRRMTPDVVITFGEDGLYWHPDHIAVHERTTAAVAALAIDADTDAPALYYVTMPAGAMRAVVTHAAEVTARRDPNTAPPRSILGVADADAFGAHVAAPTLVLETGGFAADKLRALTCHRSQFRDCALALVDEGDAPRLLGTEHFRRAHVGTGGETFIDRLGGAPTTVRAESLQS
jgi:LmbE family N-acetylglucosaminyl deacetylase